MSRLSLNHGHLLQLLTAGPGRQASGRAPGSIIRRSFWTLKDVYRIEKTDLREPTPTELNDRLKNLLRVVPHALTVVTSKATSHAKPTGLLVSSFNSVTLQPIPYVSFNIRSVSSTLAAIKKSRKFIATIIDDPFIADAFAQQHPNSENIKDTATASNCKLRDGFGGVFWLKCRYIERHLVEVGDHNIIVGEVLDFGAYDDRYFTQNPMVYFQGEYRRLKSSQRVKLGLSSDTRLNRRQDRAAVFKKVDFPTFRRIEPAESFRRIELSEDDT